MQMTPAELAAILDKHTKWRRSHPDGVRANFAGVDLSGANLMGAYLWGANFVGANLTNAYLREADLMDAQMTDADLRGADLSGALFHHTRLSGANLRGANLRDAEVTNSHLPGRDLLDDDIPVVAHIDRAILAEVKKAPHLFNMDQWFKETNCGTAHCRAGWAVIVAGAAGRELLANVGWCAAGGLIYAASRPGRPVPDFFASNEAALADLRACAAEF